MATDQIKTTRARAAPAPAAPVPPAVLRARVLAVRADGLVDVRAASQESWTCEVLDGGGGALHLAPGDRVLVLPGVAGEPPCVLGRIGRAGALPARLCVATTEELELRCGPASITLRKDGKVVTRGVDVAAVASRRNRIKGASVEIN